MGGLEAVKVGVLRGVTRVTHEGERTREQWAAQASSKARCIMMSFDSKTDMFITIRGKMHNVPNARMPHKTRCTPV